MFSNRHAWFEHELQCHRLKWCCQFCSAPPFDSEAMLESHMQNRHARSYSSNQILALLNASRISQQPSDLVSCRTCPLCDWDSNLTAGLEGNDDPPLKTLNQLRRHLGSHMEQLALFALPRLTKTNNDNAVSNEAAPEAKSGHESNGTHGSLARDQDSNNDNAIPTEGEASLDANGLSHKGWNDEPQLSEAAPETNTGVDWSQIASKLDPRSENKQNQATSELGTDTNPKKSDASSSSPDFWIRKSFSLSEHDTMPFPRHGAGISQSCGDKKTFYIHGGLCKGKVMNDTWIGDAKTLSLSKLNSSPLNSKSIAPIPRFNLASVSLDEAFIIVGGFQSTNEGGENRDLWVLMKSRHWKS